MTMSAVMSWFGRPSRLEEVEEPFRLLDPGPLLTIAETLPLIPDRPPPAWTPDRLVITDALWGEGYQFPGGEIETLRLAKPLGLSAASSLLLLGAGARGPARSVAHHVG